jgi:DNA mismatch endonuclease (patch repair protein)
VEGRCVKQPDGNLATTMSARHLADLAGSAISQSPSTTNTSYPYPKDGHVSARMRRNRKVDSKPERMLRSALHSQGLRFRKNWPVKLEGRTVRPDLVFTRQRIAVFVDGCFWHRCPQHGTSPRFNYEYWASKLENNVARDRLVDAALHGAGWTVIRIWEHVPVDDAAQLVINELAARRS